MKADADSVAEFLRNNLTAFIENATKNSGRQMTLEEYMEVAGVANEDALVALFVPEIAEYEIISEYSYEDGILTLRERGEEFKIDVSLTSKTLVLKGMIEDGESAGIIRKSDMPNNLKRVG